ncbi:chorismate synthase [Blautia sp. XA-2221]|uniref:chorismate synthase n=1 Tax=Blautia sp. XA-2221 TaxID=2903961 RepID=UPI002378CA30|nr:chorismate synthase [Blautia sp. XA-2221]
MNKSTFGKLFTVTTWGESHGKALGAVVDGCPAGLELDESHIQKYLNRRKPGQSRYTTARKEGDQVEILSGVFEGRTTGTPVSLMVRNMDQRSGDYGNIAYSYRPGHADFTFDSKYGFRDYRGGGRSSGRETVGRVAAGAVAIKFLESLGISFCTYTKSIGPVVITEFHPEEIENNAFYMPDKNAAEKAGVYLEQCMKEQDSAGGIIECRIKGVPAGLGSPVFEKLDAVLAQAVMSVGAVKGVEIGEGFHVAQMKGSQDNDGFAASEKGIVKTSNHAGGIMGGISDGSEIFLRAAIKPTPSVSQPQETVTDKGQNISLEIHGRHDPVIVPRAVVVIESMCALAISDALLCNMGARLDKVQEFYKR